MYIALQAVDSVAADARARFTVAAEGAAEIAAKKMRGLLTPIITATNHGWKFRIVALKGAEGRLRDPRVRGQEGDGGDRAVESPRAGGTAAEPEPGARAGAGAGV